MLKSELITREIQRLREENAELKEAYATYRERCANAEAILSALNDEVDKTETHARYTTAKKTYDVKSFYPFADKWGTHSFHVDNKDTVVYNGDINIGIQTGETKRGDTNGE